MDKAIKLIIACEAFKGELEAFKASIPVKILWIEQALHNTPDKLHLKVLENIQEACEKFDKLYTEERGNLKFVEDILNLQCKLVTVFPSPRNHEVKQSYQSRKTFFPDT